MDGAADFRILSRRAVDALLEMKEYNRFSKGILGWVGFRTNWIPYENVERVAGETNWSFWKLFLYSIDGIIAFSTAPLAIASMVGILFCLAALIWIVVIIVKALIWGGPGGRVSNISLSAADWRFNPAVAGYLRAVLGQDLFGNDVQETCGRI